MWILFIEKIMTEIDDYHYNIEAIYLKEFFIAFC